MFVMVSKFLISFLILIFATIANADEVRIIKCKHALYKYEEIGGNIVVYSSAKKRDKGKWHVWPYPKVQDDNKHFLKIYEGGTSTIENYVVTAKYKKVVLTNGNTGLNGTTKIDFNKRYRTAIGTWLGKPYDVEEKCKKVKPK